MRNALAVCVVMASVALGCASSAPASVLDQAERYDEIVALPEPDLDGSVTLEETLVRRRSQREFASDELPLETIGQLLWAAQGITDDEGHRTAPSAGALYPLELYALTATTLMHYLPSGHRVEQRADATTLPQLRVAAFDQEFVSAAPAVLLIAGVLGRTQDEYGAVAGELMNREAGHAAQNVLLQATALELGAVPIGGFDPPAVARLLALPPGEEVLYLLPVGLR